MERGIPYWMTTWKEGGLQSLTNHRAGFGSHEKFQPIRMQDFHIPFQCYFKNHALLETSLSVTRQTTSEVIVSGINFFSFHLLLKKNA